MAAYSIQRSKNWLAMFYHRIKARCGPSKAITATARKIAVIFYKMIKEKTRFNPLTTELYMQTYKEEQLKKLKKQVAKLGLLLVPNELVT